MPGSAAIRLLFACFHLNSEHGIHAPQPLGIDLSTPRAREGVKLAFGKRCATKRSSAGVSVACAAFGHASGSNG
jgi:hypothetical protein